jgi:hypothetical protein
VAGNEGGFMSIASQSDGVQIVSTYMRSRVPCRCSTLVRRIGERVLGLSR